MHERMIEFKKGTEKKNYVIQSEAEMEHYGQSLALSFHGGEIIALEGNLGAGKTTLAKGIAKGFGIDPRQVTSPTFVLMNVYPVTQSPTIRQLCHIDTYRLNSPEDLIEIGIQEYLDNPHAVTIIEWPVLSSSLLPSDTIYITITFPER